MSGRPGMLRGLLLAVLPLVVLLALIEAGLWAFGSGDAGPALTRGFDRHEALLVPEAGVPGAYRTRLFEDAALEQRIPPKGARQRVLLLGGSSTMGFSAAYLAGQLAALAPQPGFEVVNLGRYGYGSERVGSLCEQALVLEPDLVVIYSGHNEFVEGAFKQELGALAEPPALLAWLSRLRSFRWLSAQLARDTDRATASRPQDADRTGAPSARDTDGAHTGSHTGSHDGAHDGVLSAPPAAATDAARPYDRGQHVRAFEANMADMLERLARADIPVVLCTVIANDLSAPMLTVPPADQDPVTRALVDDAAARARALIPPRFGSLLLDAPRLREEDWGLGPHKVMALSARDAPEPDATLDRAPADDALPRQRLLGPPFDDDELTDDPLVFSVHTAHWTSPAAWSPRVKLLLDQLDPLIERRLDEDERRALAASAEAHAQLLALWPECAAASFQAGMALWALGDGAAAAPLLTAAADHDGWPARAHTPIQSALRQLAASHAGVTLFDADALARAACPDGITGYELLMDQCHLHPGARKVLLEQLAPVIVAALDAPPR